MESKPPNTERGDAMVAAVVRTLPTATISLTPPPVDTRQPEKPLTTRRTGRTAAFLLAPAVVVAAVVWLGWGQITGWLAEDDHPNQAVTNTGPATVNAVTSSVAPTAAPCPDVVTTWFPESTAGAELVALYDTDGYVVTVCRGVSGQFYYDGQRKGVEASSKSHIFLPAQKTSTGFTAVNVDYLYSIDGLDLTLTRDGVVVRHWTLTPVG